MKVLFVNEIENSTVRSVSGSLQYPADSIYHPFLKKKFKSLLESDVLTIDLAVAVSMDSLFLGYFNIISGSAAFFDGSLSPIGSPIDLTDIYDSSDLGKVVAFHFSPISVKRIVITASCDPADQLYIGGVGAGMAYSMPTYIERGYDPAIDEATTIIRSPGGQTSRNRAASLRSRQWGWPDVTRAEKDALDAELVALGTGKPVWIDPFEGDSTDFDPPMYAIVADPRAVKNPSANRWSFSITFKESR